MVFSGQVIGRSARYRPLLYAEQDEQTMSDYSCDFAVHRNFGTAHALHNCPHLPTGLADQSFLTRQGLPPPAITIRDISVNRTRATTFPVRVTSVASPR